MKFDTDTQKYTDLVRWYRKVKTQPYRKSVNDQIMHLREMLDGNHALYFGIPEFRKKIESSKYLSCLSVSGEDVIKFDNNERKLPFEDSSYDVIVLMHALDLLENPYNFIREIDRVASDDAKIFIVGFNKISVWGLINFINNNSAPPWFMNFHPTSNIREWFKILSYESKFNSTSCFLPATSKYFNKYLEKISFMQKWLFPNFGGIYFHIFNKKIIPLTPYKMKFKDKYIVNTFPKSTLNRIK